MTLTYADAYQVLVSHCPACRSDRVLYALSETAACLRFPWLYPYPVTFGLCSRCGAVIGEIARERDSDLMVVLRHSDPRLIHAASAATWRRSIWRVDPRPRWRTGTRTRGIT